MPDQDPLWCKKMDNSNSIQDWWSKTSGEASGAQQKMDITVAVYMFWHVWKERGRRIFQNEEMTAAGVATLVRAEVDLLFLAKRIG